MSALPSGAYIRILDFWKLRYARDSDTLAISEVDPEVATAYNAQQQQQTRLGPVSEVQHGNNGEYHG